MPFTPFHMGPGLALKALAGRHFSVLVFGIAQVAMDIEPLIGMMRNAAVLHGWSHTYVGATVIGAAVAFLAPTVCRLMLDRWNRELEYYGVGWLASPSDIGRVPVVTGAFIGTYSHVALDSFMHGDITPLAPWSEANGLLGVISLDALHVTCVAAAAFGAVAWFIRGLCVRRQRCEEPSCRFP